MLLPVAAGDQAAPSPQGFLGSIRESLHCLQVGLVGQKGLEGGAAVFE